MADHEFFFTIELSGRPDFLDMLRELVSRVLAQVGRGEQSVSAVVDVVNDAVLRSAASGARACRLTFVAHDGRLDIAVSSGDGTTWESSHAIA